MQVYLQFVTLPAQLSINQVNKPTHSDAWRIREHFWCISSHHWEYKQHIFDRKNEWLIVISVGLLVSCLDILFWTNKCFWQLPFKGESELSFLLPIFYRRNRERESSRPRDRERDRKRNRARTRQRKRFREMRKREGEGERLLPVFLSSPKPAAHFGQWFSKIDFRQRVRKRGRERENVWRL